MNKKGQNSPMGMPGVEGNRANPLIYVGIFVFVLPFLGPIIKFNVPGWVSGIGVVLILIGAALSIYSASQ